MSVAEPPLPSVVVPLPTRRATVRLGRALARQLAVGDLVVLTGELGAGKTFLARAICRALGVPPGVRVASPSFALVHEHRGRLPILHADLYRIADASEVEALGLRDARAEVVMLVEWGEPFVSELGGDAWCVELLLGPEGRRASICGRGTAPARLAALREAVAGASHGARRSSTGGPGTRSGGEPEAGRAHGPPEPPSRRD